MVSVFDTAESTPTGLATMSAIAIGTRNHGAAQRTLCLPVGHVQSRSTSFLDRLGNRKHEPCQKGRESRVYRGAFEWGCQAMMTTAMMTKINATTPIQSQSR